MVSLCMGGSVLDSLLTKVWTQVVLSTCNLKLGGQRQKNQNFKAKLSNISHLEPGLHKTLLQANKQKAVKLQNTEPVCCQKPKIHKSSLLESSRHHTQSKTLPCDPFSSFVFEKNLQLHTWCVRVCKSQGAPMKSKDHLHSQFSPCTMLVPEPELKLGGSASVWGIILRNIFHIKHISSLPDPCPSGLKISQLPVSLFSAPLTPSSSELL